MALAVSHRRSQPGDAAGAGPMTVDPEARTPRCMSPGCLSQNCFRLIGTGVTVRAEYHRIRHAHSAVATPPVKVAAHHDRWAFTGELQFTLPTLFPAAEISGKARPGE